MSVLEHSPARILREALLTLGHVVAGSSFVDSMPESQSVTVSFSNTSGRIQGRYADGETQTKPGIQVRVRAKATQRTEAWSKIAELANACDGVRDEPVDIDQSHYKIETLNRIGDILTLGTDPSGQFHSYTFNLIATVYSTSEE